MTALTLNLEPILNLSSAQFYQLCAANPELKLERNANGELIIMSPTGGETGRRNIKIAQQLANWTDADATGIAFDSSTGFKLPNGADRSPDAAWIPLERWNALTLEQRKKFLPLCPDFVIELLSPTDSWQDSWQKGQRKMEEYRENGCRLGWLLEPETRRVAIYRQNLPVEELQSPSTLSGEDVLPGFILNLQTIWS
jgi:Uma2 family endonuclease